MKVVVNPKYSHLDGFVRTVLNHDYKADATYRAFRNVVEDVTVDGERMVIKIFKKPTEINRIVYSFLRPTKARRSYEKSFQLLKAGILVPDPIAYMEKYKGLFFHTGCYISLYIPHHAIDDFVDYKPATPEQAAEFKDFLKELAEFAAMVHNKGIAHNDFNKDNILYRKVEAASLSKKYQFALIDLNRVKFGRYNVQAAAKDMSNIHLGADIENFLLDEYCKLRSLNREEFGVLVKKYAGKYTRRSHLKDVVLGTFGLRKHRTSDGYTEEIK